MNEPKRSVRAIFNDALEILDVVQQANFLQLACGADTVVKSQVEDLLEAHHRAGGFMNQTVFIAAAGIISQSRAIAEKLGEKIGRYKLLRLIGEGGFGVVYLAEQTEPVRRQVAIKVIKLGMDSKGVIARFEAERQALAMMNHQSIAKVLDAGATQTGRPYFVMELVEGVKITEYCEENKLSTRERLELFIKVCDAIQHAHQKAIIHRDIKPSNILVATIDGRPMPKIIDFGIAKAIEGRLTEKTLLTFSGQFIGTPDYMSPEQARGSPDIDTRSDIYSLGVLLYELITGSLPFNANLLLREGLEKVIRTIQELEPIRPSRRLSAMLEVERLQVAARRRTTPSKLAHALKCDLDWIVLKALEKDRVRRYDTAKSFAQDIECYLNHKPVTAAAPSLVYHVTKLVQRYPLRVSLALTCLFLLIGIPLTLLTTQRIKDERDMARQFAAIQDAELSSKNGHWRDTLRHLQEAEAVGYADTINLGLLRAEAWTALVRPDQSKNELLRLTQKPNLGDRSSIVWLRWGEHELFDAPTAASGGRDVQKALTLGLTNADELFAQALLAGNAAQALDLFHQALKQNSSHHGAHIHSMSLEFILGHHEELKESIRFFKSFFPDDPSAAVLEAEELALAGNVEEARKTLNSRKEVAQTAQWKSMYENLPMLAAKASHFDLDKDLADSNGGMPSLQLSLSKPISSELYAQMWLSPTLSLHSVTSGQNLRMPHLPCMENGALAGQRALADLMKPLLLKGNIAIPIEEIKASWSNYSEAWIPMVAAIHLESLQPTNGLRNIPLLDAQACLFQMAAGSSSLVPGVPRLALYLATQAEYQLVEAGATTASVARSNCLANCRFARDAAYSSPAELQRYSMIALELKDYDLARELLIHGEEQVGQNLSFIKARVDLEFAAENPVEALKFIDHLLTEKPADSWALNRKSLAKTKIHELNNLLNN